MKRLPQQLTEISQAIRELRQSLGLTQQEFAYRVPTAIRTVARWENNQPPHGKALVRLAQLAESQDLREIAAKLVSALQLEMASHDATDEPELKGWLDGLQVAFRYRHRRPDKWAALAQEIIDAVDRATTSAREVRSQEVSEFGDLSRQLRASLERFKPE
jgi:transcriptional regulator with XRE-family HTH domain